MNLKTGSTRLGVGLAALLVAAAAGTAQAQNFSYPNFSSTAGLQLNGTSASTPGLSGEGNTLSLTAPVRQSVGTMYYGQRVQVNLGFTTEFRFRMRDITGLGSDGIAFIVQNSGATAMGGAGGGMGFATNLGIQTDAQGNTINQGIANSVAVAFDTWDNSNDWATIAGGNVLTVQTNGLGRNRPDAPFSLGGVSVPGSFNDTAVHSVRITYTPGFMQIFYDNLATPRLTVPVDLSTAMNLTNGQAFVGFTASTGGFTNVQRHEILDWSFGNNIPAPGAASLLAVSGALAARRRRRTA
ncbi:MAG: hypothetical protein K2Q20_08155 [Phycisphaerales bacterium]|nr:hypothetical protein [Phycisphaerales bacterium]